MITKILTEFPPFLDRIRAAGMNPTVDRTVFPYGNELFNPGGLYIPMHLMIHENVHSEQQLKFFDNPIGKTDDRKKMEPKDAWWDEYLKNSEFCLSQEIEAYKTQYRYFTEVVSDRNKRHTFLRSIASDLSGEMYGNIISMRDAMNTIGK